MSWLTKYYGEDLAKKLCASVVKEGESHAIVRIQDQGKTGYVLVKKFGKHSVTPHESLHEGVARQADVARMEERLKAAEG